MERNLKKKEQAMSALREKMRSQNEKWQNGLKAVEQVKTKIYLLEEKKKCLSYNLNEINESEKAIKDLTDSLNEKTQDRKKIIQDEQGKLNDYESYYDKEVSQLSLGICTCHQTYDRNTVLEEFKRSVDENRMINDELAAIKDTLVSLKNKKKLSEESLCQSNNRVKTYNKLVASKKSEYQQVLKQNEKLQGEIMLLQHENNHLLNKISEIRDSMKQL